MSLFDGLLATPPTLAAFGGQHFIGAMLRFEAALARAQSAEGLIPPAAAQSIADTCKVELFDVDKIQRDSMQAGSVAPPLVEALREAVGLFNPEAVAYTHFGATGEELVDTATVLATREVLLPLQADLQKAIDALLALAERHAATPMLARTALQPGSVTSFGFRCVEWAAPLVRARDRVRRAARQALQLQFGGVPGMLAHMRAGASPATALALAAAVRARMAADLRLRDGGADWHAQRDDRLALGCELGLLAGSLGQIGTDLALLHQHEVAEVLEPLDQDRGPASVLSPQPGAVALTLTLAAAQRAPQQVATLLAAMPQRHGRALGGWQAELAAWPQLLMAAHASLRGLAAVLAALRVDASRMRANIDGVRAGQPSRAAAGWLDPALAEAAGLLVYERLAVLRAPPAPE